MQLANLIVSVATLGLLSGLVYRLHMKTKKLEAELRANQAKVKQAAAAARAIFDAS